MPDSRNAIRRVQRLPDELPTTRPHGFATKFRRKLTSGDTACCCRQLGEQSGAAGVDAPVQSTTGEAPSVH